MWRGIHRPLTTIFAVSICTRTSVFIFSYIADRVLIDYDSSAIGLNEIDSVNTAGSHLVKWDGVHFLSIASEGYKFENQYAFFPGLPYGIRYCAIFLMKLLNTINVHGILDAHFLEDLDMMVIASTMIVNVCGALTPCLLYLLGRTFPSMIPARVAYLAAILYCFPGGAAIFMSAPLEKN